VRPLLEALVGLLLVVGTSHAYWADIPEKRFTQLCPTHDGGDREYAGHGPEVQAWVVLEQVGTQHLYIHLQMTQRETRSDWSSAWLNRTFWLYSAPPDHKITKVWNAASSYVSYTDTDTTMDFFYPGDTLVYQFVIMGDSSGNDIGNCREGGISYADDAYLSVNLERLWVWVEEPPVLSP
jgi:hypothetical protein